VAKTYSLKLNGQTSVHEQIIKFEKLVTRGIEFTPIPVGSPPNTVVHPALQDHCTFQILASALVEFLQVIIETESRLVLLDILAKIQACKITTAGHILKLVAFHSKSGKFQPFTKQSLGMALVASGESADRGNSSKKPCFYYARTGSCRNGDQCQHLHSGNEGSNSSSKSSNSDEKIPSKLESKEFHPMLSSPEIVKVETYLSKTEEM